MGHSICSAGSPLTTPNHACVGTRCMHIGMSGDFKVTGGGIAYPQQPQITKLEKVLQIAMPFTQGTAWYGLEGCTGITISKPLKGLMRTLSYTICETPQPIASPPQRQRHKHSIALVQALTCTSPANHGVTLQFTVLLLLCTVLLINCCLKKVIEKNNLNAESNLAPHY